jgi:hypothetical protein
MTSKRSAVKVTLPVVKHKLIVVRELGTRTGREFEEELAEAIAKGYKVYAFGKDPRGGVQIQMGKTEDWTLDEFLTEVKEHLAKEACR